MLIAGAVLSIFLFQQGAVLDETRMQFYEAMRHASEEGISSLIPKLDSINSSLPPSPAAAYIEETIQAIGILHPGSVPDRIQRLEKFKTAAKLDPEAGEAVKRIGILQAYYASALKGDAANQSEALADPVLKESIYGLQAMADAALRARDYETAEKRAMQAIEKAPFSPLLANAHMILGLSSAFRGDPKSALLHFQHALGASDLPNVYGDPRHYVSIAYRFSRTVPGAVAEIYDEIQIARLSGIEKLKDPQGMIYSDEGFLLLDKEAILTISPDGKIVDTKPVREIVDIAAGAEGKIYSITDERMDAGAGSLSAIFAREGEKKKQLKDLCSIAVDAREGVFFLDRDKGVFRGNLAGAPDFPSLEALASIKGRLIRADRLGNLYILDWDRENILVISRNGERVTNIAPSTVSGKKQSIEYLALDLLNHLYILTSDSLQVFAMIDESAGLEKKQISMYSSEQRPRFRDLKVLGVSATGEVALAGKDGENWVYIK